MAKARALDKRRHSIRNIRKITRTMELISTAQFKRAMDRAMAAAAYTRRITALVGHLPRAGWKWPIRCCGRGRASGRAAGADGQSRAVRRVQLERAAAGLRPAARAGRRGARDPAGSRRQAGHLGLPLPQDPTGRAIHPFQRQADVRRGGACWPTATWTHFSRASSTGWTWPTRSSRASAVSMPWSRRCCRWPDLERRRQEADQRPRRSGCNTSSCPRPQSILDEVVPASFKVRLFKCFLDAAVSEQIARMVAMKAATENADAMIGSLSMAYNRARQGQITSRAVGDHRRRRGAERIDE